MSLDIRDVCFSYGERSVLDSVSFEMGEGILSVLGPNGAGKSTLVKCLAGVHLPSSGTVTFGGADLRSRDSGGPRLAYMSQEPPRSMDLTVLEVMLLGLAGSLSMRVSDEELDRAMRPLEELGLEELAQRPLNELSGGQCQMVMIAQCLVADPEIVLLDEPMNNLDLHRELQMFDLMRKITDERGLTTLMVLHDVNFAARYSDRLLVLKDGRVYADGAPEDVVTEDMLRDVYRVEAQVDRDSMGCVRVDPVRALDV